MFAVRAWEHRVIQQVINREPQQQPAPPAVESRPWADRLVKVVATTAVLVVVGSYLQELVWVFLAVATAVSVAAD